MRLLLLPLFVVGSLFASLSLSISQASVVLQPQQFLVSSLISVGRDSQLLSLQSEAEAPVTTGRRDTPILYDLVQELRTLPVGKEYSYYLQVLEQQGYLVLDNYNDHRHWEFALEKMQQNLRLTIAYNAGTKTSTMITVSGPRFAPITKTVAH